MSSCCLSFTSWRSGRVAVSDPSIASVSERCRCGPAERCALCDEPRRTAELPVWSIDKRLPVPAQVLEEAFSTLLHVAEGAGSGREGLAATPARAARAWRELTVGYAEDVSLTTFDADGYDEIVAVTGIPFWSLCEHHLLPFHGTVDVAYLPGARILGLSKFPRLVHKYSRRLQVQERLGVELADAIEAGVGPRGVMVRISAEHMCMAMRGVRVAGSRTVTSVVRGRFREHPPARAEALGMLP